MKSNDKPVATDMAEPDYPLIFTIHCYINDLLGDEERTSPAPIRESYILQKYINDIPIYIFHSDCFGGIYGYPQPLKPEITAAFEREKEAIENAWAAVDKNAPRVIMAGNYITRAGYSIGHTCPDYGEILENGLDFYTKKIERELEAAAGDKKTYLEAMLIAMEATAVFSARFSRLAFSLCETAANEDDCRRLRRIGEACARVPMQKPRDFFEAVQSVYLLWSLNCISEKAWCSISLGKFDQYMYPYYLQSLKNGESKEQIILQICALYRLLDYYRGVDCAMSIGAADSNDADMTNELYYLLVEAEKRTRLRAPLFGVRVNPNTPRKLLEQVVDEKLFEIGQPTFYNELGCRRAVRERGIDPETASRFSISSCMAMVIAGKELSDMWGCVMNMHLPLELAVNNGNPINGRLPFTFKSEPKSDYKDLDEIFDKYYEYLCELVQILMDWNADDQASVEAEHSNPWYSALTEDCITLGRDRAVAARYHSVVVEAMCFANTADAFSAIGKLVFEEKKYTLDELVAAARCDYINCDMLLNDLKNAPKYGTLNKSANRNATRVLGLLADFCESRQTGNKRFLPSLHTLDTEVSHGKMLYATLDGRRAGEPYNKNAGASKLAKINSHTELAIAAAGLEQHRLSGGQALDVYFGKNNMNTAEKRNKIIDYIITYFRMGGLQLQVNGISADTLQKAYDDPASYEHLIVRIGGHSQRFVDISDGTKLDFIKRFRIEEEM